MKIRQGFVSNSSSSSFIMIGVDSAKTQFSEEKDNIRFEGKTVEELYIEERDVNSLVGIVLANYSDEDYLESQNFSVADISKYSEKLSEELNVDVEDVKLYFGTYPC